MYVPRGRRSQTTPPTAQTSGSGTKTDVTDRESTNVNPASSTSQNSDKFELKHHDLVIDTEEVIVHKKKIAEINSKPQSSIAIQEEKSKLHNINTITNMADTNIKCEGNKFEVLSDTSNKDYNEEKEFQRASKV